MKHLLVVLLLAGCAQTPTTSPEPVVSHTTVIRYTSQACEPAPESKRLRDALKDAARWKSYAESLEKLPSSKVIPHEINP